MLEYHLDRIFCNKCENDLRGDKLSCPICIFFLYFFSCLFLFGDSVPLISGLLSDPRTILLERPSVHCPQISVTLSNVNSICREI